MQVDWTALKTMIVDRNLSAQYVVVGDNYWIKAIDGAFNLECLIPTDPNHADTVEFISNYKANGNKSPTQALNINSTPAFASKNLGTKSLFKRVVGKQFEVSIGDNTLIYTQTFPWVKFMSLEIVNGQMGDYVSLYILDTATGTFSTYPNAPLNQFGFNTNIAADFYQQKSEFDADLYVGLQIKIIYHSVSNKTVGINYVMNEVK